MTLGAVMKCAQSSFVLAALILGPCMANAQEQIVRLQCDGTADFYNANPPIRDMKVNGIYLEIRKDAIKVAGSTGWDGMASLKLGAPIRHLFFSSRLAMRSTLAQ
jgi:hypothetical protein